MIALKRAYEAPAPDDGYRVLVDRVWPRGVSKDKLHLDLWLKEVGPSTALRQWFGHDPAKWDEFKRRYTQELADNPALDELKQIIKQNSHVTLVYGSADTKHNQAVTLKQLLEK